MGCHTWFYRKIERTQEEATIRCLKRLKHNRNLCWKIYNNPYYLGIDWSDNGEPVDKVRENQLYYIKILNRQIKAVHNGYYQKAIWNKQNDDDLTKYVDGKGLYIEDTGYHDVFRKYGYPEDKLFSLQETLDYINNPKNECEIEETTIERLNQFWREYPEGMICFG